MNFGNLEARSSHFLGDAIASSAAQYQRFESISASETSTPMQDSEISRFDSKRKRVMTTRMTTNKNLQHVAIGGGATILSTNVLNGNDTYTEIAELLELGARSIRERHKKAQRRYRKKQKDLIASLENNVQALRREIKTLEQQHHRMSVPAPTANFATSLQCFRLIRDGLQFTHDKVGLVSKTMVPDVEHNTEHGHEVIVRSWCHLKWFDDVEVQLENLHKSAGSVMVATTKTSVTISQRTLAKVFPHLQTGRRDSDLASKLLDQRIVMNGSSSFVLDTANERVASIMAESDMLTPMLRILGTLEDVDRVFANALVSPDFKWGPM